MQAKNKKVLIFSLVYLPRFVGGAELAVKEITDQITGIDFDMVTLRTEHRRVEKVGNIVVHRVGLYCGGEGALERMIRTIMKYMYPCMAFWKARALHRDKDYDTLWSIMANYAGFASLFFKQAFPEVSFLLTLQEGDPIPYIKKRVGVFYPVFKKIFERADLVQTISQYLANFAVEMGFSGTPIVIPNGVDVRHFSHPLSEVERGTIRQDLGFSEDDIVLVSASRLVKKNGLEDVIDALRYLPKRYTFLIIGSGELEQVLKSKAKILKLEDRVRFIGYVPHSQLPKYFHASDVFIRPSLSEGLGSAFLEAMTAGLPVVATNVGGISDFLKDKQTGLFCKVEDPESIADTVKLYENPVLKKSVIENGEALMKESYEWSTIAREIKKLL